MKTIIAVFTFWTLFSAFALASPHSQASNSLSPLKRKPFVSPEEPAILQQYKRTKRQVAPTMQEFQQFLLQSKATCAQLMGLDAQKSLLYEENPTPQEKCLMECVLKRVEIMNPNNRISSAAIARIADMVSNSNALVISIATATAENCNRIITTSEPCEAAYQINRCIANEMRAHKLKLMY